MIVMILQPFTEIQLPRCGQGVSLYFEHDEEDGKGAIPHLINLIDSPGHVDFSSEAPMGHYDRGGLLGCWWIAGDRMN
jgi:hypothetical protein